MGKFNSRKCCKLHLLHAKFALKQIKNILFEAGTGKYLSVCYKLVHGIRVSCLFTGQYNTKGYDDYRCHKLFQQVTP